MGAFYVFICEGYIRFNNNKILNMYGEYDPYDQDQDNMYDQYIYEAPEDVDIDLHNFQDDEDEPNPEDYDIDDYYDHLQYQQEEKPKMEPVRLYNENYLNKVLSMLSTADKNHYQNRTNSRTTNSLYYNNRPYNHHHNIYRKEEKIDNNLQPDYGEEMLISGLNYGVFDKEHYYMIDEGKSGYEFPNGGKMKFRRRKQGTSILEITDNQFYKIEIDVEQINQIVDFKELKMICICSSFPPQYYVSYQKQFKRRGKQTKALLKEYEQFISLKKITKPNWRPFWKRILNIPLHTLQQMHPNELILGHLLVKNGAIFIKLFEYEKCIQNFKEELVGHKQLEHIQFDKQILESIIHKSYNGLLQRFSLAKFQSYFKYEPKNEREIIQKFEIMFSILSLQNTCKYNVTPKDIFTLAEYVNQFIMNQGKSLYVIWKALRSLTPHDLQILKTGGRDKQLEMLLITAISKIQTKSKKLAFSEDDINEDAITVPLFKLTPSGLLPYGWSTDLRNRLVRHYRKMDYQFMKLEVVDDNFENGSFGIFDDIFREEINRRMLEIKFLNRVYIPLGWTQSQLKNAAMWFTLKDADCHFLNRQQLIQFLGDFSQIKNPALKAARMGQNLSTGYSINVRDVNVIPQDDSKSEKGMMYTDGIGMISHDLVEKIQKKLDKKSTVYQVRFRGYKGLLSLNRQLEPNTIVIRKSMDKFKCPCQQAQQYLDILDCNYHKTGYLNRQIILLLQSNGVHSHQIIDLQREFINKILNLQEVIDEEKQQNFQKGVLSKAIDKEITSQNSFKIQNIGDILGKIKREKMLKVTDEPILRKILCEKYQGMFDLLVKKSRIKVQKSARILGIIDQYFILQENEVYCTISKKKIDSDEEEQENISGRVMVTRNPCMHPADIRVVTCVGKAEAKKRFQNLYGVSNLFQNLKNTVIFPQAGAIPLTSQISGSDLDGDEFFITWDERIIPEKSIKPYIADEIQKKQRVWQGSDYPQIISFFTEFISNDNLGRIGNSHLAKADKEGPQSADCLKLCQAYNMAVDYPKKGYLFSYDSKFKPRQYPHFMQKYDKKSYFSKTALGRVYDNAKQQYKKFVTSVMKKQIRIKAIPAFLMRKYPTAEIRRALKIINQFNEILKAIMEIYKFERQSQVYALHNKKQNKDKLSFLAKWQLYFFNLFFSGLPLENNQNPQEYYKFLRETAGQLVNFGDVWGVNKHVESRLLLWYHILNYNLLNKSDNRVEVVNWLGQLRIIAGDMKIDLKGFEMKGLLWFCVPTITFMVFKMNKCFIY